VDKPPKHMWLTILLAHSESINVLIYESDVLKYRKLLIEFMIGKDLTEEDKKNKMDNIFSWTFDGSPVFRRSVFNGFYFRPQDTQKETIEVMKKAFKEQKEGEDWKGDK